MAERPGDGGTDLRLGLPHGSEKAAAAARTTLGPRAGVRLIEQPGAAPSVASNACDALRSITLEERIENTSAQLVRKAAQAVRAKTGDGGATAAVLAETILREGVHATGVGAAPDSVRRGVEQAIALIDARLAAEAQAPDAAAPASVGRIAGGGETAVAAILTDTLAQSGASRLIPPRVSTKGGAAPRVSASRSLRCGSADRTRGRPRCGRMRRAPQGAIGRGDDADVEDLHGAAGGGVRPPLYDANSDRRRLCTIRSNAS
jgi:hypothetical protein